MTDAGTRLVLSTVLTTMSSPSAPPGDPFVNCPTRYVSEKKSLGCECQARFPDSRPADFSLTWPGFSDNSTLNVRRVTRADNGTIFTCLMTWNGQHRTTNYTLQVAYGPDSAHTRIHGPTDPMITDGTLFLNLTCEATEVNPSPLYTWDDVACLNNDTDQGLCVLQPQPPWDDGRRIQCTARSTFGDLKTGTSTFKLKLKYPPSEPPQIQNVSRGLLRDGETVWCIVSGGKPLVSSVNFSCSSDPPHEDQPDIRTGTSVLSMVTINSATITGNTTECICHAVWEPKEELYLYRTSVVIPLETQVKSVAGYNETLIYVGTVGASATLITITVIVIFASRFRKQGKDIATQEWKRDHSKAVGGHYESQARRNHRDTETPCSGQTFKTVGEQRWRSYNNLPFIRVQCDSAEHYANNKSAGVYKNTSPLPIHSAAWRAKRMSQSCSALQLSQEPPVSQWRSHDNDQLAETRVAPFEADKALYTDLLEDEGATYFNVPGVYDYDDCLSKDNCQDSAQRGRVCHSQDVPVQQHKDAGMENGNTMIPDCSVTLSRKGTSDDRFKERQKKARVARGHPKTAKTRSRLDRSLLGQPPERPPFPPHPMSRGKRASRSCSDLHLALQTTLAQWANPQDNHNARRAAMSTNHLAESLPEDEQARQVDVESVTESYDIQSPEGSQYFILEEDGYETCDLPNLPSKEVNIGRRKRGVQAGQRTKYEETRPYETCLLPGFLDGTAAEEYTNVCLPHNFSPVKISVPAASGSETHEKYNIFQRGRGSPCNAETAAEYDHIHEAERY